MKQIYPLHEDVVQQFCGMPVCVVMNDGSRHIGILSSCRGGKLLLNADRDGGPEAMLKKAQPAVSKKKKGGKYKKENNPKVAKTEKTQLQTQSYPYDPYYYNPQPYYPWGGAVALDLAAIALLFLLL
ncbi:hypothetical protein [Paenibacillus sp. sgz302251]|uniref:hypothetical protein n=1 Tax=Paenibacillus sp. sgz302251 TaxID=3414493 RepID=UPI003C7C5CD2